jgi:hypothetical protein
MSLWKTTLFAGVLAILSDCRDGEKTLFYLFAPEW